MSTDGLKQYEDVLEFEDVHCKAKEETGVENLLCLVILLRVFDHTEKHLRGKQFFVGGQKLHDHQEVTRKQKKTDHAGLGHETRCGKKVTWRG